MITKSITARRDYVWSRDPARDKDAPGDNWEEFVKTGDVSHVKVKEGARLCLFKLSPLTRVQMLRVLAMESSYQINEAVAFGLKGVDGYVVDSIPVELEFRGQGDEKRVNERSLNAIWDAELFAELGARILHISRLETNPL